MTKPPKPKNTPQQILQSYYTNIESKHGASIPEWITRIRATGLTRHGEIVNWLKTEHGTGHGHATLLAHDALHDESLMSKKYEE